DKTYWAVVKKLPEKTEATLTHYLIKNERTNKSTAYDVEKPNTKKSVLHYKVIGQSQNYNLL
ncbi:MAG TPA: RNA pseudouridine synthase, partial [Porphyromonadaceae bacterium]|nr:RNA pseudouridine synthase [Porphyromonadaceae bacterium]